MSDVVIKVEGVGKSYMVEHRPSEPYVALRDVVANRVKGLWANILGHHSSVNERPEEFWALRDISFDVNRGDIIGIIGRNGAGKSTLLKILSRITEPAAGRISIKGRVASLLEIGTGFHGELSGRENVYLNGAILGMTRREIDRKFDEIVAFAEVEKFLDTPVKHFSSGMYLRLAFAIAAHLEPEILVIDEVLAVGDAAFQKKCLRRMSDVSKEGRTILFVSHNMGAIEALSQKCMWVNRGAINLFSDNVADTINKYVQSMIGDTRTASTALELKSDYFKVVDFRLSRAKGGNASIVFSRSDDISLELTVDVLGWEPSLTFGYALYRREDKTCLWWSLHSDLEEAGILPGRNTFRTSINPCTLNNGTYTIEILAALYNLRWILEPGQFIAALEFTVEGGVIGSTRLSSDYDRPGLLSPVLKWDIKHLAGRNTRV